MQCYQVNGQQDRQQRGLNDPNFVLTPAPHGGLVAQPNKNNIGTNYQLPGLGSSELVPPPQLNTANNQQFFGAATGRPLSTKLGLNNLQTGIQGNQPVKLQQNLQIQHHQLPIQNIQLVDHQQQQYNQLQHLQQMQEIHQTKKQKQRIQYQNRSQVPSGGILSSKNLHVSSKNIINNSSQGTLTQEQHQAQVSESRTQVNSQQQMLDGNFPQQFHQNQIHNTEQKPSHQDSFIENQSPIKNDNRNKDSRNSKRSVVFSKNKHVGNFQIQQMSEKQTPSTPKVSIGSKTREPSSGQMLQSVQGQQILGSQPPSLMNSTNTQIRVNAPNTVKINKNTIKNLVIQKANQQQQLQHLQEMQMHLNSEEKQAQGLYLQNNQLGSHVNNQQNIKTLINQKRRSNAVDQMRDNNGITLTQKGLSSSSALNNHSRIGKKMYPSNMNVTKPNEQQMLNQNQQQLFNKTMSNMTTQNSSNNGGQSINGVPGNGTSTNNPYSKSFSKQGQQQADNLINSLMVVKINSVQASQDGISPNQVPQIQTVNFQNLTTEQQLQVIQHHQQYMQQQLLEKQLQQNIPNQPQGNLQQQPTTDLTSQSSIKDQLAGKGQVVRPQSQNNKIMHHSVNNSQNNMSQQFNELQQQNTGVSHQGQHQQTRSNTLQMASMQNGIKQTSGSDLLKQNTQQLGVQKQITLAINNQSNTLGLPGQQIQSPSSQQVNQAGAGQKLISSKHLQIQQIRMINNSSVDNYNGNNSDNDSSHRYGQMAQTQYYSGTSSQQAQNQVGASEAVLMKKIGSPGNSKYFIKNQLRHISKMNDDQEGLNSINQGLQPNDNEDDQDQIPGNVLYNDADSNSQGNLPHFNNALHFKEGGITLEDDVESMLSEQFNASNESMFRVRGIANTNIGGGLNAGDSTFRCNDSMYDEDRGLISESEDGWYGEKDQGDRLGDANKMDDISEHSSDYVTDSEPEVNPDGQIVPKKVKKKGEKGEKKKKKKKKVDADNADGAGKEGENPKVMTEPKKMVQDYKKLEQDTKDVKQHKEQNKKGSKVEATNQKNQKTGKEKENKKMTAQQIKVNIQTKKSENKQVSNTQNDMKNNFNSPVPKSQKQEQINKNIKNNVQTDQKNKAGNQTENKGKEEQKKEDNKYQASIAHTPLKKAKKNGLKLQALNNALPKNLQECYDRFFESDFKINPQFEYENASLAQKFLEQFDEPDGKYLDIATRILDSFLKEYGSESNYLDAEGRKLDQDETHNAITEYLNNLGVSEWISINFQKNQVAPTSVTHDPKTGKCKMNIKLPCEYREGRMMGVLDHEIGTHFLRKHNEKQQQWYKKRDKFDMKTCIATEEGLACTNQMVQTVKDGKCRPFLYRSALNYYAAYMAKEMSFVDLFRNLEKYVDSPQARWKFTLRVKRGLADTSQKGGLYKDQVYLEGAINILSHRHILNFKALLCGKLSLQDYKRNDIFGILNYEGQLLPPFMKDMDEYMRCLDVIAETNHIEDADDDEDYDMEPGANHEVIPLDNKEDEEPNLNAEEENTNPPPSQLPTQDTDVNNININNLNLNNQEPLETQQETAFSGDLTKEMIEQGNIQAQQMNNIDFIIQSSLPEGFGDASMQNNSAPQNNDDALETNNQQNINETQN